MLIALTHVRVSSATVIHDNQTPITRSALF